jgi:hypothetical protein
MRSGKEPLALSEAKGKQCKMGGHCFEENGLLSSYPVYIVFPAQIRYTCHR